MVSKDVAFKSTLKGLILVDIIEFRIRIRSKSFFKKRKNFKLTHELRIMNFIDVRTSHMIMNIS